MLKKISPGPIIMATTGHETVPVDIEHHEERLFRLTLSRETRSRELRTTPELMSRSQSVEGTFMSCSQSVEGTFILVAVRCVPDAKDFDVSWYRGMLMVVHGDRHRHVYDVSGQMALYATYLRGGGASGLPHFITPILSREGEPVRLDWEPGDLLANLVVEVAALCIPPR